MIAELLPPLLRSTFASTVAILLVLLLRRTVRQGYGAGAAYALWAVVPLAVVAVMLPAPERPLAVQFVPDIMTRTALPETIVTPTLVPVDPAAWLAAFWVFGAVTMLWRCARLQRRFMLGLGILQAAGNDTLRAGTAAPGCPALVGVWRPCIVLPFDFEQRYDELERELILAHERTHRERGDTRFNVVATLLRCLYWFNPLLHLAASRYRLDQELACDATVIARFPDARRQYAGAMLKTQFVDFGLSAGCHWQSSQPLKERIAMLKRPLPNRMHLALGVAIAAAFVLSGGYAAWAVQPVRTAALGGAAAHASYRRLQRIDYPPAALAGKIEGVVYVKVHVGADGKAHAIRAYSVHPSTATVLGDAAVAAIRTWTFDPANVDGRRVGSDEIIPVEFGLDSRTTFHVEGGTLDAIRVVSPDGRVGSVDRPATENTEFRMTVAPQYPPQAVKAGKQGKVVLKVHVDERGRPLSARVYKAEPPEAEAVFGDASIVAVMKWRFNPAQKAGKAVAGDVLVPFTYTLHKVD